jgi:hypothetical protein
MSKRSAKHTSIWRLSVLAAYVNATSLVHKKMKHGVIGSRNCPAKVSLFGLLRVYLGEKFGLGKQIVMHD